MYIGCSLNFVDYLRDGATVCILVVLLTLWIIYVMDLQYVYWLFS